LRFLRRGAAGESVQIENAAHFLFTGRQSEYSAMFSTIIVFFR
jgi:hypothetical protein